MTHPAVQAHEEAMKSAEEDMLPNHDQLLPYLVELTPTWTYAVYDQDDEVDLPGMVSIGLAVQFKRVHGYGGCQMVLLDGYQRGLHVWCNGSDENSAFSYWVLPSKPIL